jgi:hypothetical protein
MRPNATDFFLGFYGSASFGGCCAVFELTVDNVCRIKIGMPPRYNKLFGARPFGGATMNASGGWNDVFFFEVERVESWWAFEFD